MCAPLPLEQAPPLPFNREGGLTPLRNCPPARKRAMRHMANSATGAIA